MPLLDPSFAINCRLVVSDSACSRSELKASVQFSSFACPTIMLAHVDCICDVSVVNGTCAPCPIGSWKTVNDTSEVCPSCPIGRTTIGPSQPYEVNCTVECGPNTYVSPSTGGVCVACGVGTFSFYGASLCCPPGSKDGGGECVGCPAGTYGGAATSYACWPCPKGRFTNTTGNTACASCPAGTDSVYGGSNCTLCKQGAFIFDAITLPLHGMNFHARAHVRLSVCVWHALCGLQMGPSRSPQSHPLHQLWHHGVLQQ